MTIAIKGLAAGWARGGVQVVKALRVAQGRTVPFFGRDVDTKLKKM